jgi:hypothetical protein
MSLLKFIAVSAVLASVASAKTIIKKRALHRRSAEDIGHFKSFATKGTKWSQPGAKAYFASFTFPTCHN